VHGRAYGRQRGARMTRARNWLRILLSGLVPEVLALRTGREVFGRRRHRGRFLASLPVLLVFNGAWASGEALGHLDELRGSR
jgi:hypothetical protein